MKVVCCLGGFHLLMSALGSLGTLMDGSGLTDALETSYATNTLVHMITGKAISCSLRGHFLVEATLKSHLLQPLIPAQMDYSVEEKGSDKDIEMADDNVNLSNSDDELNFTASMDKVCETCEPGKILSYEELAELQKYYISIEDGSKAIDDLSASQSLDKLNTYLEEMSSEMLQGQQNCGFNT